VLHLTAAASSVTGRAPPNQALHLTGAAILVSRDIKLLQRPRQVSLVVSRQKNMPVIRTSLLVRSTPEKCFDLARSVDVHVETMGSSGERAIAGRTKGLLELGEEVTWRGKHFGITQDLTSRITQFERPKHFRDSMVRGAFKRIDHDHYFEYEGTDTRISDIFDFDAPGGFLGRIIAKIVLAPYLTRLLEERNQMIKTIAEKKDGG
jgi:ligand-binding SRPBCC domain-containing protein